MKVDVRPVFCLDQEREQVGWLEHGDAEVADQRSEAVWETIGFLKSWLEVGWLRKDQDFGGLRSWRVVRFHRWMIPIQ